MKTNTRKVNLQRIRSKMSAIDLKADNLPRAIEIVDLMKKYKFSAADVLAAEIEARGFDLLCAETDTLTRLPFEQGKKLCPIGIFPYPSSNVYISLNERSLPRRDCDESKIPSREFLRDLMPLREELNRCMRILGKPLLEGCYYVKDPSHPKDNHIVNIGGRSAKGFSVDYFGDDERAKCRTVQIFDR